MANEWRGRLGRFGVWRECWTFCGLWFASDILWMGDVIGLVCREVQGGMNAFLCIYYTYTLYSSLDE